MEADGSVTVLTGLSSQGQGIETTLAQVARGGTARDDWYIGFNLSRKFY